MAQKTVQLSVRVSDDDAAFLASFDVEGAVTPSEKMRAILRAERQRHGDALSSQEVEGTLHTMMRRARQHIRNFEKTEGVRSDLVARLYERVPEIAAALIVGTAEKKPVAFEAALAADAYALLSEVLSLALVSRNRVYDDKVAEPYLPPVLELVDLIRSSQQQRED